MLVFLIFFATPGADPAARIAGRNATPEVLEAVRKSFGFDQPFYVQYLTMMKKIFITGDLTSFVNRGWKVVPAVMDTVPVTLSLVMGAAVLWVVFSLIIGIVAAATRGSWIDKTLMVLGLIGISMPTKSSTRWISDGESMVKEFTALGYETDLQYAEDDIPNQLAQIENMVTKGAKVLIIAAIDGTTLSDILKKAKEGGAKVFAYDRLISKTGDVDYYTTFDNFGVGVLQGTSLIDGLKERFPDMKPWNVELFGGSPDDTNAFYFYDGAMSVLQPLIDAGQIAVVSGQMGMDKVGTLRWDGAVAQARMDNLLSAFYTDKKVQGVLAPYDGLSRGIISSLKGVGYGSPDQPMPIVTGQDAELASVKGMIAGEQYSTVFKDTRELAKVTAKMVDTVLSGKDPEINDTKTYNNGVKVVPSYLLKPVSVGKGDIEAVLVGSGYYTADQINN
jgi:putative multiple sugar transport system substrate-binding protein